MSVDLVEKRTIDRAVTVIAGAINACHVKAGQAYWPILSHHVHRGNLTELGTALWRMNARCVARRYREFEATDEVIEYRWDGATCLPEQAIKTISYLMCQCDECGIAETKLFAEVGSIRRRLVDEWLQAQPAYRDAEWA